MSISTSCHRFSSVVYNSYYILPDSAPPHRAADIHRARKSHSGQAPNFTPVPIDLEYAASVWAVAEIPMGFLESAAFATYLDKRISAALPTKAKANTSGNSANRTYCFKHGYNSHSSAKCRQKASLPEYTVAMKTASSHNDVANGSMHGL